MGGGDLAPLRAGDRVLVPALFHRALRPPERQEYGFEASFNPTFPDRTGSEHGWVAPWVYGLNQGPLLLMTENARTEFLWRRMRTCPYLANGLRRAGFRGGWLD